MKKTTLLILLFPVMIWSQVSEAKPPIHYYKFADNFINSFYVNHDNVDKIVPFFDEKYFATFYKFSEHMHLKNNDYGIYLEKTILKARDSPDGNTLWRRYKISYKQGLMVEELKLRRSSSTSPYKITYWQTKR